MLRNAVQITLGAFMILMPNIYTCYIMYINKSLNATKPLVGSLVDEECGPP